MDADSRAKLERLVEAASRRAWRLAYSWLGDGHEAFDCVQQAFLAAAKNPGRIPDGDAWPWFCVVVANEARNLRRKKRPSVESAVEPQDNARLPGLAAQREDDGRLLWQALEVLPREEREAIVLTHVNGLTHALAAQALGIPEKTLSAQVARGMERLRTKLKSREDELTRYLATLPVAVPPGGWESALAAWKSVAVSALGVSAASATIVGGAAMAKYLILAASVAVALGVGLIGGYTLKPAPAETRSEQTSAEEPKVIPGAAPKEESNETRKNPAIDDEAAAGLRKERDAALADVSALKKRVAAVEQERDTLKSEKEQLSAELTPFLEEKALKGPTFTFGEMGKLAAIRNADWKEMAEADAIVRQCLLKIYEHALKGERAPDEVYIALQENTEKVRKYEYRTIRKMPTAAQHNGELTHPISMANLVATTLKLAGLPLSEAQIGSINRMGEQFEADFAKLRNSYTEKTLRTQKMLDEYKLKGEFRENMLALLTLEQYAVCVDAKSFKIAHLDLHDVSLMIIHTSPIITGPSAAEIKEKFKGFLTKRYSLSEAQVAQLGPILDNWLQDVTPMLTPVAQASVRYYTSEQGAQAGTATVKLHNEMLTLLTPSDEQRKQIIEDNGFFIPRLVQ